MSTPNKFRCVLPIIVSFLSGVLFMGFLFLAYFSISSKEEFVEILNLPSELKYYFNQFENRTLREDTGKMNPMSFSIDKEIEKKGIPDVLYRAYQKNLDEFAKIELKENFKSSLKKDRLDFGLQSHWVYIPLNQILAYAVYLKFKGITGQKATGITIQMGRVDKDSLKVNLSDSVYRANENYISNKDGAIIPMFIATTLKNVNGVDELEYLNNVMAIDCNCGNPPKCEVEQDPKIECAKKSPCKDNCPEPKQGSSH